MKSKNNENRKFPRVKHSGKIQYKEFHNPLKVCRWASAIDIGMGGASFETFEKLPQDLILTLFTNILLPYTYQSVSAKIFAKVVHVQPLPNQRFITRVHFIAVDRKGAAALSQWIFKQLAKKERPRITRKREKTALAV